MTNFIWNWLIFWRNCQYFRRIFFWNWPIFYLGRDPVHIIPFSPVHSTAIDLFYLSSGFLTQIYLFYFYLIWFSKSTVICNLKWFCQIFKCCGSVCGWLVVDGNPPPPPLLNTKYSAGGAGGPIITIIIINITITLIFTIIKVHTLILLHHHIIVPS